MAHNGEAWNFATICHWEPFTLKVRPIPVGSAISI